MLLAAKRREWSKDKRTVTNGHVIQGDSSQRLSERITIVEWTNRGSESSARNGGVTITRVGKEMKSLISRANPVVYHIVQKNATKSIQFSVQFLALAK